ncbi:hypothetical protein F5X68DRAFT_138958 [Plectosphaerella plurivora]|uniref:2-oxoadipate dioxygenase/decarboxylase n=1 Tax=Plectosphaerella plurivora TaxID=936078 RepID=A0A9P8V681_9PEZI|nr:hypothetical protein F5X68DRAFT_138958 [Plectosphaerella plurivora]
MQQGHLAGKELSSTNSFADVNDIRDSFTMAMSAMYREEVPLYGDLIRIVQTVNDEVIAKKLPSSAKIGDVGSARLDIERHGAIRLGTPYELRTVSRIFSALGLSAVGYYDLSVAGLPMHATCFRPTDTESLHKNPFRIFTTLLRPELLQDEEARQLASVLLERRQIFTPDLLELLDTADKQHGRLTSSQATNFVTEAMKTFSWRPVASATEAEYKKLASEHSILADIASFRSSHINHLTPRTLDITAAQKRMREQGLQAKDRIEGPPRRECPILLRQTSFIALRESIRFPTEAGTLVQGTHRARFGEIEERGAAVTPAGRTLYDELLQKANENIAKLPLGADGEKQDEILQQVFEAYPDNWSELRRRGLVYSTYRRTTKPLGDVQLVQDQQSLERLIDEGYVAAEPITYEDFLPFSAAGIFQSNLRTGKASSSSPPQAHPDQAGLEAALGSPIQNPDDLYLEIQNQSLRRCISTLSLRS